MIAYQINNGRWQIKAIDGQYNKLSHALVSAILWRSFATKADADQFIKNNS